MLAIDYVFLGVVALSAILILKRTTARAWRQVAIALVFLSVCFGLAGIMLIDRFALDTPEWHRRRIAALPPGDDEVALAVRDAAGRFVPLLFLSSAVLTVAAYRRSN